MTCARCQTPVPDRPLPDLRKAGWVRKQANDLTKAKAVIRFVWLCPKCAKPKRA